MIYTDSTDHTDMALHLIYDANMRKDHYDGEHSLYRLSALINFNTVVYLDGASGELNYVLNKLSIFPVRPHQLLVESGYGWEVVWYATEHLVASSQKQYIKLILEFIAFLKQHQTPLFTIQFLERFLLDDPNKCISGLPNEAINFSPAFNEACFGNDGEIEVIRLQTC
ncbi:hypothetical protein ACI2WT_22495 [Lysinibacillus fusiformis]